VTPILKGIRAAEVVLKPGRRARRLKPRRSQAAVAESLPHYIKYVLRSAVNSISNISRPPDLLSPYRFKLETFIMPYALKGRNVLVTGGSRYVHTYLTHYKPPLRGNEILTDHPRLIPTSASATHLQMQQSPIYTILFTIALSCFTNNGHAAGAWAN
jgi:hypothetical protein